jgi:hypothetical protein
VAYSRPTGLYGYTDFNGTSLVFTGNVDDGAALVQTLTQVAPVARRLMIYD